MMALGACSSSQVSNSDGDQIAAAADAGTDAVPTIPPADGSPPVAPGTDQAQAQPPAPPSGDAPPTAPSVDPAPALPVQPATADAAPAVTPPADTIAQAAPAVQAPVQASASPSTASGESEDYTVQSGDTLMKIAYEHYGDLYRWKDIYNSNKDRISNPTNLTRGTVIKLEKTDPVALERNGDKYLIHEGDTLGTISNDVYGIKTKWKRLWENNKQLIKDPNRIFAGFYLYYMMTDQDRMEKEDTMKNRGEQPTLSPNPLSEAPTDTSRVPSSVSAATAQPQPQAPAMPAMATLPPQQSAQVNPSK